VKLSKMIKFGSNNGSENDEDSDVYSDDGDVNDK
jgi:hypothetical protein